MSRVTCALTLVLLIIVPRAEGTTAARFGTEPLHTSSFKPAGVRVASPASGKAVKTLAKIVRFHAPKPHVLQDDLIDEPSDSEDDDPDSPGSAIDTDDDDDRTPQFSADSNVSSHALIPPVSRPRFSHDLTPGPRQALFLALCRLLF